MLIMTQDKTALINMRAIERIKAEGHLVRAYYFEDGGRETIGEYASSDLAEKVVGEIADEYGRYLTIQGGPLYTQPGGFVQPQMFEPPKVYKMPRYSGEKDEGRPKK